MADYNNCLKNHYNLIAKKFVDEKSREYKIICVFITGSYYSGRLHKNSDIDLFLITNNISTREKGVKIIESIKVSYYINPLWKIKQLLSDETGKLKRPTAEFVYFSTCIYGKRIANNLQKISKSTIQSKLPKFTKEDTSYFGWKLEDKLLAFKRKNYSDSEKEYLNHDLFDYCIDTFFIFKRSYRPHSKYVLKRIKGIDSSFFKLIEKYLKERSEKNIEKIANCLLKMLQFKAEDYFKITKANLN